MSFHSRQSFSVSFFHVSFGPLSPTCHQSVYITCCSDCNTRTLHQRSFFFLKMRSRSSSSSFASISPDLTVATVSGLILILQICLIMALSLRGRFVLVSGHVLLAWSFALRTQELYISTGLVREVAGCENW